MTDAGRLGPTQAFGFTTSVCIHCGFDSDIFTAIGGGRRQPQPGDATLCVKCSGLQIVADDGASFRKPTEDEAARLSVDGRVLKMRDAIKMAAAHGGIKSIDIVPAALRPDRERDTKLAVAVHAAAMAHFGLARGDNKVFTEDQVLDMAAAGATLATAYFDQLPPKRRLEVLTSFMARMLDQFKGRGPKL